MFYDFLRHKSRSVRLLMHMVIIVHSWQSDCTQYICSRICCVWNVSGNSICKYVYTEYTLALIYCEILANTDRVFVCVFVFLCVEQFLSIFLYRQIIPKFKSSFRS